MIQDVLSCMDYNENFIQIIFDIYTILNLTTRGNLQLATNHIYLVISSNMYILLLFYFISFG